MNLERERALRDATKAVCMYCSHQATGYTDAEGPNAAGNYVHKDMADPMSPKVVLCYASGIWVLIRWEKKN